MQKYKGKKILILGGADVHCKLIRAAREMGVITMVADYLPPEESPGKQIADTSYEIDVFDLDSLEALCKQEHVDAVLSTSLDPCQRPYQELCERLSLPCYCSKEQVFQLTDKEAFKELCLANGIDIIPTYDASIIDLTENQLPVIVKPARSRGSRGLTVCWSIEEVRDAILKARSISDNHKAIIEKYMGGYDDFTVTYFFINGEAHLVKIADRFLGTEESGMNRNCIASVSPSKHTEMYLKNVNDKMIAMLKKMGITNGPVFFQGFIDGETVRFYDPGFRFPGAAYEIMIKAVQNYDLMKMMVEYALTGDISNNWGSIPNDAFLMKGKAVGDMTPTIRPGIIHKIIGIEEIKALPEVVYVTVRHKAGDVIGETHDVNQHVCQINFICDGLREYKSTLKKAYQMLHVYDVDNKEMLISPFDVDRITAYAFGDE